MFGVAKPPKYLQLDALHILFLLLLTTIYEVCVIIPTLQKVKEKACVTQPELLYRVSFPQEEPFLKHSQVPDTCSR